jgi:hypothetical protein
MNKSVAWEDRIAGALRELDAAEKDVKVLTRQYRKQAPDLRSLHNRMILHARERVKLLRSYIGTIKAIQRRLVEVNVRREKLRRLFNEVSAKRLSQRRKTS